MNDLMKRLEAERMRAVQEIASRPAPQTDAERLESQFKLVCRKCGSENVRMNIEEGIDWGGETGYQPGTISVGCNACGQNDFYASI